jgi:pyruvate dehydrogenase E2 component (dihydrolipoamide acetyltransferase)
VEWLVKEGDYVEKNDPIAEVTTDKVNMEVESPEEGYIGGIRYQVGDVVPVTKTIAYILAEGEEAPETDEDEAPAAAPAVEAPPTQEAVATPPATGGPVDATPVARRMAAAEGIDLSSVEGSGVQGRVTREDVERLIAAPPGKNGGKTDGKVRATPAARRVASERGIRLETVTGSGPRGRVQEADVLAAGQAPPAAAPTVRVTPEGEPVVIPLEGMRRTIANRMQASAQEAPHITLTLDIDMTKAIAFREYANERVPEGEPRISMTAVIVKAVAWTLRQHPMLNSYMQNDEIWMLPNVNVGVAVALEEGLIVPVVRDADLKGLRQIGEEVVDLAKRAREGRLGPDDVTNGTFTVTNLGMFGISHFAAIINPPEVAILAVGQTTTRFVPDEQGQPVARPLMTVTISADHRAIDGALAARFLASLREALEEPASILL